MPHAASAGARFGAALAAGDVTGDGVSDLAVGAPGEKVGANAGAGGVTMLNGSASGLTTTGSSWWNEDSSNVAGVSAAGDGFGSSLAMGDVNGDGRADLAVGIPGTDVGTIKDAGAIEVLYASGSGISGTGSIQWTESTAGVPGDAVTSGRFGASVRIANVESGYADVIVGAPGGSGVLVQLRGARTGLTTSGSTSVLMSGSGNAFGAALY
jgi:hypothetical protein